MLHDEKFDLHARTTIDSYFSYIESAALRVGDVLVEFEKDQFYINGMKLSYKDDLPFSSGALNIVQTVDEKLKQAYHVSFFGSSIEFKFYKHYLTIGVTGNQQDFAKVTGLLGEFSTGDMYTRAGKNMEGIYSFEDHAFEWQVAPGDVKLFHKDRHPQLPYERCRLPTAGRPSRRRLLADTALLEQAKTACAHVVRAESTHTRKCMKSCQITLCLLGDENHPFPNMR